MRSWVLTGFLGILGLLAAACGEPSPDPRPLEDSFAAMEALESFHFEIRIQLPPPANVSQDAQAIPPITMAGEFQVPDRIRIATSGFVGMETIAIGRSQYRRMGGPWGAQELDEDDQPSMLPRIWMVLKPLQPEDLEYRGEVTLGETRTHHLRSRFSEVSLPGENEEVDVTFEVWIGVEDGLWRQAQTEVGAEATDGTVTSVFEFSAFGEPVAIDHPDEWWPLLRDLRWTPSEPVPAQPFVVTFVVENHGGVPLNTTIDVAVNHETVRTLSVTDLAPGASREIEFEITMERGTHNLTVGGNNLVIEVFDEFGRPLGMRISPRGPVLPGQPVTLSLTVPTRGAITDREVVISINGEIVRTFLISETPLGTSQTFTLEVIRSEPGQYQVEARWQGGGGTSTFTVTG